MYNLQGQSSLVFLADNFMLGPLLRTNVYHGFVVGRNSVRTNDIVLAFSETSRAGRCRRQATRVFKLKVLHKLCLSRLLKEDLSEVNDLLVVVGENNLSCEVNLLDGEDGKRVRGSHGWQRGEVDDDMSREETNHQGQTPLLIFTGAMRGGTVVRMRYTQLSMYSRENDKISRMEMPNLGWTANGRPSHGKRRARRVAAGSFAIHCLMI